MKFDLKDLRYLKEFTEIRDKFWNVSKANADFIWQISDKKWEIVPLPKKGSWPHSYIILDDNYVCATSGAVSFHILLCRFGKTCMILWNWCQSKLPRLISETYVIWKVQPLVSRKQPCRELHIIGSGFWLVYGFIDGYDPFSESIMVVATSKNL